MMGVRRVTHFGLDFIVATEGWGRHRVAAEKAEAHMIDWLESLGPEDTRCLHCALLGEEVGFWSGLATEAGDESRSRAMSEDGWAELPDDGYSCYLSAEE